jgi:hypothetical protein
LFDKAKAQGLKYPRIVLALPDGLPLVLSLAGKSSKHAGQVFVTDGKPYGQNVYYGRVSPEGVFVVNHKHDATIPAVQALLAQLARHPAEVAAQHGKLTGNCCFCNSKLTDKRSTAVGYGAVCAAKWGLPYPTSKQAKPPQADPKCINCDEPAVATEIETEIETEIDGNAVRISYRLERKARPELDLQEHVETVAELHHISSGLVLEILSESL